jgi:hypothetical protein
VEAETPSEPEPEPEPESEAEPVAVDGVGVVRTVAVGSLPWAGCAPQPVTAANVTMRIVPPRMRAST